MPALKWTEEAVRAEAAKYDNKKEFKKNSGGAYMAALRLKLVDKLFQNQRKTWTKEAVFIEAKKYKTRKAFHVGCESAYDAARRFGILEKLSSMLFKKALAYNTRDVIYIWFSKHLPGVYKVGITSQNLGVFRLEDVAKEGRLGAPQIIIMASVGTENARILESALKKHGKRYRFDTKFDGSTEFRTWSPSELHDAVQLIKSCIIANVVAN